MLNYWRELSKQVHIENDRWWRDPATNMRINRNKQETLFLVISELVEAGEGERKSLMDDHLPTRRMAEVELADAMIRLLDYIGAWSYDIDTTIFKQFPSLPTDRNNLVELPRFFRNRFFHANGNKAEQLGHMVRAVVKVMELEDAGAATRDVESALTWFILLVCDYCGLNDFDLWGAIQEKREYNARRKDHTNEARLAAGGKKW